MSSEALERAAWIRDLRERVELPGSRGVPALSPGEWADDVRALLAEVGRLEQVLAETRNTSNARLSNIAGTREVLWQEGDHEGTPLIVLAEDRMKERDAARGQMRFAENMLEQLEREFVARTGLGASPQDVSMWCRMTRAAIKVVKEDA